MDFEQLSRKKRNLILFFFLTIYEANLALQPVLPAMGERY